jgi:hypothetical protein
LVQRFDGFVARDLIAVIAIIGGACAGAADAAVPARSPPVASISEPPLPETHRAPRPSPVPVMRPSRGSRRPLHADGACLRALRRRRILFVPLAGVRGVRTPVVIVGPIRGVNLLPRAGRPAVMDCQLAQALTDAAPLFRDLHVTGLSFSGAYDYRKRRGSPKLSEHAHGLAIDVHAVDTTSGTFAVARDYPRGASDWRQMEQGADATTLRRCVGAPVTRAGRVLRTLACRLKARRDFRIILTPDDNADHHDHLHIEAYPGQPLPRPRLSPVS